MDDFSFLGVRPRSHRGCTLNCPETLFPTPDATVDLMDGTNWRQTPRVAIAVNKTARQQDTAFDNLTERE